jgi:stage V sporulation protein K
MQRLDGLLGLHEIKKEIHDFASYAKIQRARNAGSAAGLFAMTFVFTGNPGTGKTTVARLIGEILHDIGVLPTGHLVEVDRSTLVAGYQGQTAIRTREAIENALGGVLFIDEAYALVGQGREDSYGREAIDTLVKCIEDYRGQFALVLAGYSNEMEKFLNVNPGMQSRIARVFYFPDYSDDDLLAIAEEMAHTDGYRLHEDARQELGDSLQKRRRTATLWGNAREVRKLLEVIYRTQASRLTNGDEQVTPSQEALNTISGQDIVEANRRLVIK